MIEYDLNLIGSSDETVGRDAFERVMAASDSYLRSVLRRKGVSVQEIDDIVSDTTIKLWNYRCKYKAEGVAQWRKLIKTAAFKCALTRYKNEKKFIITADEIEDLSPDEAALFGEMVLSKIEIDELSSLLDELWLGISPETPPRERNRQLLAAQLFYLDSMPWRMILSILQRTMPGTTIDRAQMNSFLAKPGVLRALVYSQLSVDSSLLAEFLLGNKPIAIGDFKLHEPPSRDAVERKVAVCKFRHGYSLNRLLSLDEIGEDSQKLSDITNILVSKLPFNRIMGHLLAVFKSVPNISSILGKPGLWKRLAFQYSAFNDLPHKDIYDRCAPPAHLVSFEISMETLNGWLSRGRLMDSVRAYAKKRGYIE